MCADDQNTLRTDDDDDKSSVYWILLCEYKHSHATRSYGVKNPQPPEGRKTADNVTKEIVSINWRQEYKSIGPRSKVTDKGLAKE